MSLRGSSSWDSTWRMGAADPLTAWLHETWFQDDGVHVTQLGAAKLGEFIHRALVRHAQP
jgi:hypothetical protein